MPDSKRSNQSLHLFFIFIESDCVSILEVPPKDHINIPQYYLSLQTWNTILVNSRWLWSISSFVPSSLISLLYTYFQATALIYWCYGVFQAPPPLMGAPPPPPPPPPPPGPPPPSSWVKDEKMWSSTSHFTETHDSWSWCIILCHWGLVIFNDQLSSFCCWFQCGSHSNIPYSDSFREWFDPLCCLQRNDVKKYQFYVKAVKYER